MGMCVLEQQECSLVNKTCTVVPAFKTTSSARNMWSCLKMEEIIKEGGGCA